MICRFSYLCDLCVINNYYFNFCRHVVVTKMRHEFREWFHNIKTYMQQCNNTITEHVTAVQKKSQQRLHVLRKLRAFYINPLLLRLYSSIIEPLLTYCSICCYPALSVKNRNRLLKISHFLPRSLV